MKKIHFKSLILLFLAFLLPATATAYVEDGIIYHIYDNQATVYGLEDYSYAGDITIPETVISYPVTAIDSRAFYNSNITSVTIPNSVRYIGKEAFEHCVNLTSVSLPDSITEISARLFMKCTSLNHVTIPNSVTVIQGEAFLDCYNLTDIIFSNSLCMIHTGDYYALDGTGWYENQPDGVVYAGPVVYTYKGDMEEYADITLKEGTLGIADLAFNYCSLTHITLPNSLQYIGNYAFSGCTSLTNITLPNSLQYIGNYAFNYCTSLTSVTLSNSLQGIGEEALDGCTSLTSVSLPNSLQGIDDDAFNGCTSLTSVTLPNSLQSIDYEAFNGCTSLAHIKLPHSLQSIGYEAFNGCTSLTNIIIPDSVNYIENHAFAGCTNLVRVSIGRGVYYMAFLNCEKLSSIYSLATIPPNSDYDAIVPETVYNQATLYVPAGSINAYQKADEWNKFSKILEIDYDVPVINFVDDNVKTLCVQHWGYDGDGELSMEEAATATNLYEIFKNNPTITSFDELQYFTGISSINDGAFYNCSGLTSITLPNAITAISQEAFSGCKNLTDITIPDSVNSIGKYVFSGCSELTSVTLPNAITAISQEAFSGCKKLTSITIPKSVTKIDDLAFKNCYGLKGVYINDLTAWCNISFYDSYGTNPLRYAQHLFLNDEEITNLVIPESITTIKQLAFYGCSGLNSVTLHKDVTSIQDKAFLNCTGLTSFTCHAVTPPSAGGTSVFSTATIKRATLYVPQGSVAVYSSQAPWSNFGNIVAINGTHELLGDTNGDGVVNIGDVNVVIEIILSGGTNAAADVNGDGVVNISDLNAIINIILGKH